MSTVPTYKEIWRVSSPIILSMLAQNVINVINTAFLGRYGEIELGASALAQLFYVSLYILGFGFGNGAQIMMSRRNGEKNFAGIGKIFDHSMYFLAALGILLFLFVKYLSPLFLKQFISSQLIYEASDKFLRYRIWGIFFAFGGVLLRAFYVGITRTRYLSYAAMIMAVINVFFDYTLIFGNFGFPRMGIAGAGISSVIAEGVSFLFFLSLTVGNKHLAKYQLFRFPRIEFALVRKILDISVFIMLQTFLSLGGWFVFFMFIEHLGERALAVSNIIRSIYLVLMIPVWGFSAATNTLVSNAIGEGMKQHVIPVIRKITYITFLSTLVVVLAGLGFPRSIISIYTTDPSMVNDTLRTLYVILGALILFALTIIVFNGVSGTGNTGVAMAIEGITIVVYLAFSYLFANVLQLRVNQVWCVEYIYFTVIGTLSYWYMKKGNWSRKVI